MIILQNVKDISITVTHLVILACR